MKIVNMLNRKGGGNQSPDKIITHCIGEFIDDGTRIQYAPDFITRISLSAHYYITPSGVIIKQHNAKRIAYHAKGHNQNSIGIEWMVAGVHDYASFIETIQTNYVTKPQYQTGLELYQHLIEQYDITEHQRHSDVDPQRKKDPGDGFPWEQLLNDLRVVES